MLVFFFFFQAEDGIRDIGVTGVQTCALPICRAGDGAGRGRGGWKRCPVRGEGRRAGRRQGRRRHDRPGRRREIGRASCRERVEISVVAVSLKKKKKST